MRSKRQFSPLVIAVGLAAGSFGQTKFSDHCPNGVPLPFASIEVHHAIDDSCSTNGKPKSKAPTTLQNSVKNNFCAAAATPTIVTPQSLIDKQANTHVPTGQGNESATRKALNALGEGTLVRMKAFIIEAHFADVGTGESVNCGLPSEEENDIHIALGQPLQPKNARALPPRLVRTFAP